MKNMKRALLGLVTLMCPVFLAACYGPPNREWEDEVLPGKVVDGKTGQGVAAIQVHCLVNGQDLRDVVAGEDGSFYITNGFGCDALLFRDVDGEDNGGSYAEKTIPLAGRESLIFKIDKIEA